MLDLLFLEFGALDHDTAKTLLAVLGALFAEFVIRDPVLVIEEDRILPLFLFTHSRHSISSLFFENQSNKKSTWNPYENFI